MHVKSTVNRSRDPLATKWFCFAKGVPGRAGGHAKLAKSALLGVCAISSSVYKLPPWFWRPPCLFQPCFVSPLHSTPLPVRCGAGQHPFSFPARFHGAPADVTSRISSTRREPSRLCGRWSRPCSTLGERHETQQAGTVWIFRCLLFNLAATAKKN